MIMDFDPCFDRLLLCFLRIMVKKKVVGQVAGKQPVAEPENDQEGLVGETPVIPPIAEATVPLDVPVTGGLIHQLIQTVKSIPPLVSSREKGEFSRKCKAFKDLGGLQFDGTGGVIKAEEWFKKCEKIFKLMELSPEEKVDLATHHLIDAALNWWNNFFVSLGEKVCTWDMFETAYRLKYFPASDVRVLAREFNNLEQGNMSVTEYMAQFDRLSKYAPHLVSSTKLKKEKFVDGLNYALKDRLAFAVRTMDMDALLDLALTHERNYLEFVERKKGIASSSADSFSKGKRMLEVDSVQSSRVQQRGRYVPHHSGVPVTTPVAQGVERARNVRFCYRCGRPGHRVRDCRSRTTVPGWVEREISVQNPRHDLPIVVAPSAPIRAPVLAAISTPRNVAFPSFYGGSSSRVRLPGPRDTTGTI